MDIILSIAVFQSVISFLMLITNKGKDTFERTMAMMLLLLTAHFTTKFVILILLDNEFVFNNLATSFGFAYGPFTFLAARMLTGKKNPRWQVILHMAPFFIFSIFYLWTTIGLEALGVDNYVKLYQQITGVIEMPYILLYSAACLITLFKFTPTTDSEKLQKKILVIISLLLFAMLSITPIFIFVANLFTDSVSVNVRLIPYTMLILMSVTIIWYKMKVSSIPVLVKEETSKPEKKYDKSNLGETELENYRQQLNAFIIKEKPYLDAELTLASLADQVKMPRHHLTQLLSIVYDKNFYQFINEYRIKEAIQRIEEDKMEGNFLQLASDVGFNSKSSFNNYFKKVTNKTPTQYKNDLLNPPLNPA